MESKMLGFGWDYAYTNVATIEYYIDKYFERLGHLSIVSLLSDDDADKFRKMARGLPIVHHLSNVSPCNVDGANLLKAQEQDKLTKRLGAIFCNEDIGFWNIGNYGIPYFAPPLFERDVAIRVATEIQKIQALSSVPFLAEVPSCSFVAGNISLGEFFSILVERSGCGVCLDVSHVYSYALYLDLDPLDVLKSLPLTSVRQMHIAGGLIPAENSWFYHDTHEHPILDPVKKLFEQAMSRCCNVEAVTYEIAPKIGKNIVDADFDYLESVLSINTSVCVDEYEVTEQQLEP